MGSGHSENRPQNYEAVASLFRKKRFEINFFVQRHASKFAIFIETCRYIPGHS